MSLLIKALDKAEKAQEEQHKVQQGRRRHAGNIANHAGDAHATDADLALEPVNATRAQSEYTAFSDNPAAQAANVFEAKQPVKRTSNPILWLVGLGGLAMLVIALYFYMQLNQLQPAAPVVSPIIASNLTAPPAINPPIQMVAAATAPRQTPPSAAATNQTATAQASLANQQTTPPVVVQTASGAAEKSLQKPAEKLSLDMANANMAPPLNIADVQQNPTTQVFRPAASVETANNALTARESIGRPAQTMVVKRGSNLTFSQTIASDSASITVSTSKKALAVSPDLTRAYEAYLAGNDSDAQASYKRVLQKDLRNVDALLGMGAIAERQGRLPDALAWYQKVLEVEPRNVTALTASYAQTEDKSDKELKLKNLIANAPNSPNVYADLADYYAENNQWPEAQQAYFEAYRLNKSAENAFNLAVSLDQLGKPAVALPYYQEALALSSSSGHNVIDQSSLQQRIAAIQALE